MSYTVSKTLPVDYIDHGYRLVGSGNNARVEEYEIPRTKSIDVHVNVDTTPFDNSVDRCGDHVSTLTGSIVAFKTANVASKMENEKKIVNSVTCGFSSLIEQNLTLQNAGMEAEMHALAGELMQQCKELEHKHDVMSKDFNRIKSRYTSLFDTINKEMNNRIKQLIKPCFDFVSQVRQEQNRRIETSLLSIATTTGKESDAARIAIQTSKMKSNAENLISTASNYIVGNKSMNKAKDKYFIEENVPDLVCYAPVILCDSGDESSSSKKLLFTNPYMDDDTNVKNTILDAANRLQEKEMSPDVKRRIGDYFNQMLSEVSDGSARSQRVVALMKSYFDNNSINTFVK